MAAPRFAWGIDVGNRALKAVRLSPGPEGLIIDDFDVVEHEQVLSSAGDNKESLVQSALANFVQRHDMRGGVVAVGVSGQSSFARFIKLPPVETRKIPEIVRFEAIQQIPFPLDEVEWSYQLFQDPNSPDVEVGIFAMRKELVAQHIKLFTDVGLNVQVVQMNPLAVYNAMYNDDRLKGTTMIIDLGAENTDLIIAEGENIWLRSIPIGGNNFTETLVKAFKLKFNKAEDLKRNAATSKYGRQILQAMKPVFNDLVAEVQRSIGFYASVHRDSRITRVLALGGTFRLPGLQKYVQQNLQIEVQRIERLGSGAPADARAATMFNENILSSVSAYGLAIQALGGGKINSSLLPARIRREKMWQEKTRWFAAAAAIFVAAPLIGYASIQWGKHNLDSTTAVNGENVSFLREIQGYDSSWQSNVEDAGLGDRTRTANFNSLQQGRDTQTALISDICAALPKPPQALLDALKGGDKSKFPPRNSRQMVSIDRISMEYKPDMTDMLAMSDPELKEYQVPGATPATGTGPRRSPMLNNRRATRSFAMPGFGMKPATPQAATAGPAQRGFVVEVVCTTPKADGASFVLNNFVSQLAKLSPSNPQVSYVVKKVIEPFSETVGNDLGGVRQPKVNAIPGIPQVGMPPVGLTGTPRATGIRGNPAVPGVPGAVNQAPAFDPLQDPGTGEDMSNDTRCTIRMLVVLDPPKPQPGTVAQAQ
jgi:type IV pilus assembly protein PilM